MKKITIVMSLIVAATAMIVIACNEGKAKTSDTTTPALSQEALIKRGEYIVTAAGCDDCHTPKKMGPNGPDIDIDRRFSGHPANEPTGKPDTTVFKNGYVLFGMGLTNAVGPWGMSYAANITSDSTGIGMWTEQQFFNAIRKGLSKGLEGNRPLLPPMPWFAYKNYSDEDLKAIFAFLKSTKPVKNVVPQWKQLKDL